MTRPTICHTVSPTGGNGDDAVNSFLTMSAPRRNRTYNLLIKSQRQEDGAGRAVSHPVAGQSLTDSPETAADVSGPPENDRSSHGNSHESDKVTIWEVLDGVEVEDEDDLCLCDECEGYAEYLLDLRLAGMRRAALARMAAEGDEVAARMLADEEAEHLDRSTLRFPAAPWIRYADTGSRRLPDLTAWLVRRLDGPACRLCGQQERESNPLEVDHITPLAWGGTDHLHNLWILCRSCNRAKISQRLEDFLRKRKDLCIRPAANRDHWPLGKGVRRPR